MVTDALRSLYVTFTFTAVITLRYVTLRCLRHFTRKATALLLMWHELTVGPRVRVSDFGRSMGNGLCPPTRTNYCAG